MINITFSKDINGNIFREKTSATFRIIECIGQEKQYTHTETDTQSIYQWQIFSLENGVYENDTTDTASINIDGRDYTPINGQVIINKSA